MSLIFLGFNVIPKAGLAPSSPLSLSGLIHLGGSYAALSSFSLMANNRPLTASSSVCSGQMACEEMLFPRGHIPPPPSHRE